MLFNELPIQGAYRIGLQPHRDERGWFARAWCEKEFAERGITESFVQANQAYTAAAGTLRGLHYQTAPHEEAKFIRCLRGAVYDVIVDLRPDSASYLEWHAVTLTAEQRDALYVPAGCAHGYQTLMDDTEVFYQVTTAYTPGVEKGVRYDDPAFGIEWPRAVKALSDKDQSLPDFESTRAAHPASSEPTT